MSGLLPIGQAWIGFDENGVSIAASIEAKKPTGRRHCVMDGCAAILRCKWDNGDTAFGRHITTFEVIE